MNLEYPLNEGLVSFKSVDILVFPKQLKFILIGKNSLETDLSVLIIQKTKSNETCKRLYQILTPVEGTFCEDDVLYELGKHVKKPEDNQKIHTLGILGFIRFLQGYYLVYIEEKEKISKIGRHKVNLIKKTGILPLFDYINDKTLDDEKKYLELFKAYKLENCYYSYSYDMTNPLSVNMARNSVQLFRNDINHDSSLKEEECYYGFDPLIYETCEVFLWNYHLLRDMARTVKRKWILPIIHGYCKQINIKVKGSVFNVIIISRRSRHHAGTRYIKRGIDSYGFVANFVETEQIVINKSTSQDTKPVCSSFLNVRGSAPVYWMQEPNFLKAKPPIEMVKSDPLHYSTRKHFSDLITRYGQVVYCFNLMKVIEKTPRETILCRQFSNAVEFINKNDLPPDHAIHYIHFDYKANQKMVEKEVFIEKMHFMAYHCIMKIGAFVCLNSSRLDHSQYVEFQNGIVRVNCVDCLDRTNSFNQLMGEAALAIQICKLLKEDISLNICKEEENLFKEYRALYEEMGDLISIQYGSSLAHKQKVNDSKGVRFEFLTSITRHYNNNFTDNTRQQQIDVFLGNCFPEKERVWDEKPKITLFPSRNLKKYSRRGWHQEAYSNFRRLNRIKMFQELNHQDLLTKFLNVNNEFGWGSSKYELQRVFTSSIAERIENSEEKPQSLIFCVQPNLKLSKKVWRALNPKSQRMSKMEVKLSRPYHTITYQLSRAVEARKQSDDRVSEEDESMTIFKNAVENKSRKQSDCVFNSLDEIQQLFSPLHQVDQDDIKSICMYDIQSTITDEMIWGDLALMNSIGNLQPDSALQTFVKLHSHDWKKIQYNITTNNFISGGSRQEIPLQSSGNIKFRKDIESPRRKKNINESGVLPKKVKLVA